jgi:formylglycine-generating enzyme required for sulfatase activity
LVLGNIDDPTWEEVIVLVAANRKLSDAAREALLEECAAASARRLDEGKVESWARHLTLIGRMVRDMGEYLPPHVRLRYQTKLHAAMARNDCPLAQRSGLALSLDEIGWRAPGTFGFSGPHTHGQLNFQCSLYPVTNAQYRRFLEAVDFSDAKLWEQPDALTPAGGSLLLDAEFTKWWSGHKEYDKRVPKSWYDPKFGIAHPGLPVVGVSWFEAMAYCRWLERHWTDLEEAKGVSAAPFVHVRLPNGDEWDVAVGLAAYRALGDLPFGGANVGKAIDQTTPVGMLSAARGTDAILDAIGNVWEWQAGYADKSFRGIALRGGSFATSVDDLDLDLRGWAPAARRENDIGFRVLIELRENKA